MWSTPSGNRPVLGPTATVRMPAATPAAIPAGASSNTTACPAQRPAVRRPSDTLPGAACRASPGPPSPRWPAWPVPRRSCGCPPGSCPPRSPAPPRRPAGSAAVPRPPAAPRYRQSAPVPWHQVPRSVPQRRRRPARTGVRYRRPGRRGRCAGSRRYPAHTGQRTRPRPPRQPPSNQPGCRPCQKGRPGRSGFGWRRARGYSCLLSCPRCSAMECTARPTYYRPDPQSRRSGPTPARQCR